MFVECMKLKWQNNWKSFGSKIVITFGRPLLKLSIIKGPAVCDGLEVFRKRQHSKRVHLAAAHGNHLEFCTRERNYLTRFLEMTIPSYNIPMTY